MNCHTTRRALRLQCVCDSELNLTSTLLPLFGQWHRNASILTKQPVKPAIGGVMATRDKKYINSGVEPDEDIASHAVFKVRPFYYEHAQLSAAAYSPKRWSERTSKLGFDIDKDLSSHTHTVCVRRRDKKAIIAYKGTSPNGWNKLKSNDLAADLGIALGIPEKLNVRFRDADRVYSSARAKYSARHLEVTGHSLGGSQAIYVGRKHNAKGLAFEPGAGPADAVFRLKDDTAKKLSATFSHAFRKGLPDAKSSTRVGVVASAFHPKGGWKDSLYGISALYHLPGQERRTWIKPRRKNSHDVKNFLY